MSKVGTPIHDQKRTTKNPKKQSSAFVTSESRFFWRFFFSSRLSAVDCVIFRQDIKTWRQRKDADKLTTTAKVKRNRVEVVLDLFRYLEKWNISAVVSSPTRTFTREVGRHPMMNRYHFSQVTIFFSFFSSCYWSILKLSFSLIFDPRYKNFGLSVCFYFSFRKCTIESILSSYLNCEQ